MGSIFGVCRASSHSFPTKRLEWGVSSNIVADFSKKCGRFVMNLAVMETSHVHGISWHDQL